MFKKTKAQGFLNQKHNKMKMGNKFIIILSIFFLVGCTNRNTNNTINSAGNTNSQSETIDKSKSGKIASNICDCLKPLSDLQKNFETQKITPQEYGNKLKGLSISMQDCTNKLTEDTDDKPDLKDEVLFKMKQICPNVAEIIVPAQ